MNNHEDIIDSRDIIERISELELDEGKGPDCEEYPGELKALKALNDEGLVSSEDWEEGATLIRDSYFTDYAQELAEDLGLIDDSSRWPSYCIDWERAARELQMDYTPIDFYGVTYCVR